MTDFLRRLPTPSSVCADPSLGAFRLENEKQKSTSLVSLHSSTELQKSSHNARIPAYGNRRGWVPKSLDDFQDGGAFPEIPVVQYPANMGKNKITSSKTLALQIGEDGEIEYDKIMKLNSDRLVVYSKAGDQKAKHKSLEELSKPSVEQEKEEVEKAKIAIQETLNLKTSKDIVKSKKENQQPEFYKYTPNQQSAGHNSNCAQRVIRMVDILVDPLDVAKFKHKRIPRGPPSPPPPLQHSPPRKLTQKDQQDWKVPPCVSNWKNQKGYTIPLDKRIHADGRGLHDVTINDKFAAMSEALYIAERSAREDIRMRNEMMKKKKAMEEEVREQQLRHLAAKARAERSNMMNMVTSNDASASVSGNANTNEKLDEVSALEKRQQIEKERKREIERDFRLEKAGKRNKLNRDEDRDISEKIALGQAQPTSQQSLYDARLFNQTAGLDSGYNGGNDDSYGIYDKALFADRGKSGIYKFESERFKQSVGSMENLPAFSGAESRGQRTAPVEFEKDAADPFGLDNLLSEAKKK